MTYILDINGECMAVYLVGNKESLSTVAQPFVFKSKGQPMTAGLMIHNENISEFNSKKLLSILYS